eukprot:scaffold115438_cov23-Tisochrysis_lutea.AAC.2
MRPPPPPPPRCETASASAPRAEMRPEPLITAASTSTPDAPAIGGRCWAARLVWRRLQRGQSALVAARAARGLAVGRQHAVDVQRSCVDAYHPATAADGPVGVVRERVGAVEREVAFDARPPRCTRAGEPRPRARAIAKRTATRSHRALAPAARAAMPSTRARLTLGPVERIEHRRAAAESARRDGCVPADAHGGCSEPHAARADTGAPIERDAAREGERQGACGGAHSLGEFTGERSVRRES